MKYDDDEIEKEVIGTRMLKILSARSKKATKLWTNARNLITAANRMKTTIEM